MANTKGNQYPAWIISASGQVLSVAADGTLKAQSPQDFAYDISISTDGTVWVVSTTADPDGGGAKIYWSNGDNNWNEISTPNPGAASITGTADGFCFYVTTGGDLWKLDTTSAAEKLSWASNIVAVDYSSGADRAVWAVFPDQPGQQPTLHFGKFGNKPNVFNWTLFPGNVSPTSISGNSNGNGYGLIAGVPWQYTQAGTSLKVDKGAKRGMYVSFKQGSISGQDRFYLTTASGNKDGNQVMIWQGDAGWVDAGFRAIKTLATYYTH